jgi:hypothetical protein
MPRRALDGHSRRLVSCFESDRAKTLDTVMAGAVKGWCAQSGNGKKAKQDAAAMVELLDEGER